MSFSFQNPRTKLYLIMGITMVIIFVVWVITLAHTLSSSTSQNDIIPSATENLEPLKEKISQIFTEIKVLKGSIVDQASTSTSDTLQNTIKINPDNLNEIIERLTIATSTPTSPPTTTNLLK